MNSWLKIFLTLFSTNTLQLPWSLSQCKTTMLSVHPKTDLMFKSFRAALIFVARFAAICVAINSNLGIVMSVFDNLDLLPTKPWFTFDGWLTTAYAAAQYPKMLTSPKMCKSTEIIGSCLRVNYLGISTLFTIFSFHFSHLSLNVCGTDSSNGIFDLHISQYNILPIKCAGDINPVGSYTEANSLKIFRLVSWWFFLNVGVTTDNVSFCLFQPKPSTFVSLLSWFNTCFA